MSLRTAANDIISGVRIDVVKFAVSAPIGRMVNRPKPIVRPVNVAGNDVKECCLQRSTRFSVRTFVIGSRVVGTLGPQGGSSQHNR